MSQFIEACVIPETASGALGQYLRVKTPGAVALAGALEQSLGTMNAPCTAAGPCSIRVKTAMGTQKMIAAAAISAGAYVYGAASGKVTSVANGNIEGIALEAAAADGDIINVLAINAPVVNPVTLYAASGALTVAPGLAVITKTGSLAAMTLAAPTSAQNGLILRVTSTTAFAHTITATSLIDDGVTGGSKTTITFAAFAGASCDLVAYEGKWLTLSLKATTVS